MDFEAAVKEKTAEMLARIQAGEHVATVTCQYCGWNRFAKVYPEWTGYRGTTIQKALALAIVDLGKHIALRKEGKCYPYL